MTNEERLTKNKQISQTKRDTIERHKSMLVKTFDVKIQENQLSKQQKEALETIFLEQKWYKNYILNWCEQDENNHITKFNTKQNQITKKDKDMNDVPVNIKYLSASQRQCLISRMYANIKTLHTLKTKGIQKPGRLKYSKEETIIDLKQYGRTHKIISSKRIRIQGITKSMVVNGLDQFISLPEIEFANARLLHRGTGYFVQFVCYVPKDNKAQNKIEKTIGIDFGCSTAFTTSEGKKISASVPESERLKTLQKRQAKKVKGSKNWLRTVKQVKKEYQKITNRKNDLANKIVHEFNQYQTIVIQDEQLKNWHKNGHGKAVQHSVLGRVKSKLLLNPNTVVLGKTVPTTKLCTKCGQWHDELKVWDRTFKCDCGVEMDRDIHAAQNMVWFHENNVGVERTKVKRLEIKALVDQALAMENQLLSVKDEDSSLKAGISSH
jgi:putative transposase